MKYQNKEEMRIDYIKMRKNNMIHIDFFYEIYLQKTTKPPLDINLFSHAFQIYLHSTGYSLFNEMDIEFNIIKILDKEQRVIDFF
jgi:hypothetical protein